MACDLQVAETIETLTERLLTSTLLDDRRDACRAIKSLAKDYRVEIGAQAMEALLNTMKNDKYDTEIVIYCLDSLNYVISGQLCDLGPAATWPDPEPDTDQMNSTIQSGDPNQQQQQQQQSGPSNAFQARTSNSKPTFSSKNNNHNNKHDPSRELAEIFLKKNENVITILDAINENDSNIRWGAIRLLCGLSRQKLSTLQGAILSFPLGVSRLTGLLDEELEVLRNDGLALFVRLTQTNQDIQNIFPIYDGFGKLMSIIRQEEYLNGTVAVVMDVLAILLNLLQTNEPNRRSFLHGDHLQNLIPFFNNIHELQWTEHKTACIMYVLEIIDSMLLNENNSSIDVLKAKEILIKFGLMDKLCQMVSSQAIPISILSETLNTASDIVRGTNPTMMVQASSMMPILLLSMVKDICNEQERKLSELYNYVNIIYHHINNR